MLQVLVAEADQQIVRQRRERMHQRFPSVPHRIETELFHQSRQRGTEQRHLFGRRAQCRTCPKARMDGKRGNSFAIAYRQKDEIDQRPRSEEHTSELQSLMRISYAVICLK